MPGPKRTLVAVGTAALALSAAFTAGPSVAAPAADTPSTTDAASPGAPGLGDPVYPGLGNGGYDVSAYFIDFSYDKTLRLVHATVIISANSTQNLSRFNLDATGMAIESIQVNGRAASFVQSGEELTVTPANSLPSGSAFAVRAKYTVDPRLIKPPAGGFVANEDGFALAPQPAGAHTVFPSNDHPSDKARFAFKVTAPAGTIGVASGTKVSSETNADGSTTSLFISRDPIATEIVQVAVGNYQVVDRGVVDGVRLRDVVSPDRAAKLEPALALTAGQLAWLKQYLGEFPLERYGLLPVNNEASDAFDFTGLETQTLTLYKPKYLEQTEDKIGSHMMHELVHSWFGNSVTPSDWSALWINEGHADFYGLMYRYERGWPDSRGYTNLVDRMKYTYSQGDIWRKSSGPVAKPNAQNLFDNQRYTGGVLALFALREKIGQEAFAQVEHTYLSRHRNSVGSTEDFIDVATSVSGDPTVRPFLEDWLFGTKTPPMPNHPDWTVDPISALSILDRSDLQTDRHGN